MKLRRNELVKRYKKNYYIPPDAHITEQMILAHWNLERQLAQELLQSTPEDRWKTFDRCYTRLYADLDWLNRLIGQVGPTSPSERLKRWEEAIGPPPQSVYEIGSGKGELISHLSQNGFVCRGTEITRERGRKHIAIPHMNLSWGVSDGVHLDRFEPPETYDVVISNQVIEHLHPEDLESHMRGVYDILTTGGRYILCTPHRFTGPHDISRVFKLDQPQGMHLKEHTYQELVKAISSAGFHNISFAFIPQRIHRLLIRLGSSTRTRAAGLRALYLRFLLLVEKALSIVPAHRLRYLCAKALRRLYVFTDNICLVAEKDRVACPEQDSSAPGSNMLL